MISTPLFNRRVTLHIPTGPACNNRCAFCMEEGNPALRERAVRTTERLQEILSQHTGYKHIIFTMQEPTLNEKLPDFIRVASQGNFETVGIITNGRRLADMAYLKSLVKNGLNEIGVSIHGHNAQTHDALTGRNRSFDQTAAGLANIFTLRKQGNQIRLTTNAVINKLNYLYLKEIFSFFRTFEPDAVVFNLPQVLGRAQSNFEDIIVRYTDLIPKFLELAECFDTPPFTVDEIPLCQAVKLPLQHVGLRELWHHVAPNEVYTATKMDGLMKGESCCHCALDNLCDGVWENYAITYGWDEFEPVSNEKFQKLRAYDLKKSFLSQSEVLALMKPLKVGQTMMNWRWEAIETMTDRVHLCFRNGSDEVFRITLYPIDSREKPFVTSKRYKISYQGDELEHEHKQLLSTVIFVIRKNER